MKTAFIKNGFVLIILFALGLTFSFKYLTYQPSYKHAWAQADQYSLSKGFIRNNFNFFKPQTYVLNKQFPDNFEKPYIDAVTPVDFPLHQYLIAGLMKLSTHHDPFIFRLFVLLMSVMGMFYFFRLVYLLTGNYFKSLLAVAFAATSPVFVYYQSGFLPTIPCLSLAITGLYFYFKYTFSGKTKNFITGIAFLTLSALARTTYLIPLLSVLGVEFVYSIRNRKFVFSKVICFSIALALLLIQFFYNKHLLKVHGSMFLNTLMPAESLSDAISKFSYIIDTWKWQYFTSIHYYAFAFIVILFITSLFVKRIRVNIKTNRLLLLMSLLFLGYSLFFVAMLNQFKEHDYYFLDSFYLLIILLFSFLLIQLPSIKFRYSGIVLSIVFILGFSKIIALNIGIQQQTYSQYDTLEKIEDQLKGSDKILDSLGISRNAKILYFDAQAPNIALNQLDRVGYAIMSTTKEHFERAMQWKYDYLVFTNSSFVEKIYPVFPEIIKRIKKVYDNGNFMVCVPFDNKNQTVESFCNVSSFSKKIEISNDFEDSLDFHWKNNNPSNVKAFSGTKSQFISQNQEFGIAYTDSSWHFLSQGSHTAILSCEVYFEKEMNECNLVVSVDGNHSNLFYKATNISSLVTSPDKWHRIDIILNVPQIKDNRNVFSAYIWNKGKNNLFVDDLKIRLY